MDLLKNSYLIEYEHIVNILLKDNTTEKNIIWATNDYKELADNHLFTSEIYNEDIIISHTEKNISTKKNRVIERAEVTTPTWICNKQNNLIDDNWFEKENNFNYETLSNDKINDWNVNEDIITYPKNKNWLDYVKDIRLEICCGEAPYIISRYDNKTHTLIPINKRIGLLDRKLRVISENVNNATEWVKISKTAIESIYGFEWQGDSLFLARKNIIITIVENYISLFKEIPPIEYILEMANIVSWNFWQMDGIKCVIPNSCDILNNKCQSCIKKNNRTHNGTYSIIKDWVLNENKKFVDIANNI